MAAEREPMICVGAIAGAFGVSGEVRLKSFCSEPRAIASYGPVLDADDRAFTVRITREVKGGFAARLSGIATREEAEALRGTQLFVPRARLPAAPEDEFYHADLIGLEVVDTGGAQMGEIRAVHDHGAGDVLEIAAPGTDGLLVPFTRASVPTIDLALGRVVVDPPRYLEEDAE
ncbi:MAG: ribosome maturation factor RimM [Pseudomonadota bacterium]